jgi:predicted SnoaL-like aldol condensation-catalyzing enzyme
MTERNKACVRRFVEEVWNSGRTGSIDELVAADYLGRGPVTRMPVVGPDGIRSSVARCRRAYPDLFVRISEEIAEEDLVAVRWTVIGTHRSGSAPLLASGISVVRVLAGKLVDSRSEWDLGRRGAAVPVTQ